MDANAIVTDARVLQVRNLKTALARANERLVQAEAERDFLRAHLDVALAVMRDFDRPGGSGLRIIDGWNAVLRLRNVAKLTAEEISALKADYLDRCGASPQPSTLDSQPSTLNPQPPIETWIVFDGPQENSYRVGSCRVTYTGGEGPQRADRLILDYVHAAKLCGCDVSRIVVETADKTLAKRLVALGARVELPPTPEPTPRAEPDGVT